MLGCHLTDELHTPSASAGPCPRGFSSRIAMRTTQCELWLSLVLATLQAITTSGSCCSERAWSEARQQYEAYRDGGSGNPHRSKTEYRLHSSGRSFWPRPSACIAGRCCRPAAGPRRSRTPIGDDESRPVESRRNARATQRLIDKAQQPASAPSTRAPPGRAERVGVKSQGQLNWPRFHRRRR